MGRELREPPSAEGALHHVAEGLVRGRMGTAAGSAVVGLAAALGWPPWPAAPLLITALLLVLATLLFALIARRFRHAGLAASALLVVALGWVDVTLLVFFAGRAPSRGLAALFLVLLGLSALLHGLALARVVARDGPGRRALEPLAEAAARAREASGIVRARAESLRLAADEAGVVAALDHDLEVLVRQAEECQRELRHLEQAIHSHYAARLPRRPAGPPQPLPDPWPNASTPLRS